jgi:Ankyrin repeats (3 copies)/Ankyrin repeats (many copies)
MRYRLLGAAERLMAALVQDALAAWETEMAGTFYHGGEEEGERALSWRSQHALALALMHGTPAADLLASHDDAEIDEEFRKEAERIALDAPEWVPRSHDWWRWPGWRLAQPIVSEVELADLHAETEDDLAKAATDLARRHSTDSQASAMRGMENSPLTLAAELGRLTEVSALLDGGAGIDDKDGDGYTALILAARFGQLDVVELLLARGADPNALQNHRKTALMYAAEEGRLEIVKRLLASGADPKLRSKGGTTALKVARLYGHAEVASLLKQAGATE